ncbi:dinitrogenase iron-molybdenum cofactor biosynthesis protein [Oceanispirochaeta crateris]|uniref:Dinitrogenase iron-molybdenum cofactor biosynthesis protein n=1 Tax=Oceanispirochaeta crateris TaxID=2518645 RepID=A0A5C1QGZ9_9SPIO|nr:NifB/NifX family molybdenum-iron cluster-binding protein [Oceanispirochaeta crateris]QEN06598.1 dinitrogenase iron-molybdenum cofactor biosynthesis protein [Oceanispirochaeta crateris]
MKIVFTAKGNNMDSLIDPRFGRTEYFVIYDEDSKNLESYDNRAIESEAHGAGPKTAQKLVELGAEVLITGNGPGGNASGVLSTTGVEVYVGAGNMTVEEAYDAYKAGSLKKS